MTEGKKPLPGSSEELAQKFIQHIVDCIDASLSSELYTRHGQTELRQDQEELERAKDRLRPSFDELVKRFIDPVRERSPTTADYGFEQLWILVSSAFVAGSRGTLSSASEKATKSLEQQKSDRSQEKARRRASLKEYLTLKYPLPWPKSEQFARMIMPGFLQYADKSYSLATIHQDLLAVAQGGGKKRKVMTSS